MSDLLLELFSEEIPARMQVQAAKDLERLVIGALSDRGLMFEGVKAFSGPRRLTLAIMGLPAKQPDVKEELKGPKVDAPAAALDGFLRKTGLTKEQLKVEKTPKGDVYLAVIERAGRETADVLAEVLPDCFAKLPWPKSMRWPQKVKPRPFGSGNFGSGAYGGNAVVRWVRPLHGIVCLFDGEVVPFAFAGVESGNTTRGHRFLSDGAPIKVRHFEDYEKALHDAHVILDAERRKAIIFEEVKAAAFIHGLELIPDEGLLDEVSGLAEWPVVLTGTIQDEFMDVPPEILQTSMRTHQKYFALRDPKTGKMANRFAVVANMVAQDGGKEIIAGNERVLRARLSDADFFWRMDKQYKQSYRVIELADVVFHGELGTQFDRSLRLAALSGIIADLTGSNRALAERSGWLSKVDLISGVVGEFPELQGTMGGYYAQNDNEPSEIVEAIRDQYRPQGPSDAVPTSPIAIALSLADKIDLIVGFFGIDLKPTGSSDPFALRRAALGIIRIILSSGTRLRLRDVLNDSFFLHVQKKITALYLSKSTQTPLSLIGTPGFAKAEQEVFENTLEEAVASARSAGPAQKEITSEILTFLSDRLKVAIREKGTRHDLIDAVFSLGNEDDLVRLVARVEALQSFLKTDEGANLLAGYKRAANILKAEEKKEGRFAGEVDTGLLSLPEEKALAEALGTAEKAIAADVQAEKFVEAMSVMARLRGPVDAFFDKVKVNDDNPKVRENRLKLLTHLRATLHLVADFSKIEG